MSAVDAHVEEQCPRRARHRLEEPPCGSPIERPFEPPPGDRRRGERGGRAESHDPTRAQREHGSGDDEHGAVVGEDRAGPDLVEQQPTAVEREAAAGERPATCAHEMWITGGATGEQRDTDAGDEHERRREAGRQRPDPRIEEAAGGIVVASRRRAGSGSRGSSSPRHRSRRRPGRRRDRAAGAARSPRWRVRPCRPSSPAHLVRVGRDERVLYVHDVAGSGPVLADRHEDHRGVHVRRFEEGQALAGEVEGAATVRAAGSPRGPCRHRSSRGDRPCGTRCCR